MAELPATVDVPSVVVMPCDSSQLTKDWALPHQPATVASRLASAEVTDEGSASDTHGAPPTKPCRDAGTARYSFPPTSTTLMVLPASDAQGRLDGRVMAAVAAPPAKSIWPVTGSEVVPLVVVADRVSV